MPITFSSHDVNLTSFPHTDAMVDTIHIDRWNVAKILFLIAYDKMGFDQKQLKEPTKHLYGYLGYLCLKIPATFSVITVFGSRQDARNIEKGFAPGHKCVHFLQEESE
jgi:hypothetical protein